MIWNLLADETKNTNNWIMYVLVGVILVALVAWMFFSGRRNKASRKEYVEQLEAIAPGNKVKTAGGICGIVVEVCDDNTVIIETGSEQSGKSYVKMDKELIAQTDAKGPTQIAREEAEARRKAEKAEKAAQKNAPQNDAEDAPAAEEPVAPAEETAEETPANETEEK
jgi:preprotein translocase subunit YajC